MKKWIALFRGINVGGNNNLPMSKLVADLESLKLQNVRTYIQSGNAVFDSSTGDGKSLTKKISNRIEQQHGFRPHVLLLTQNDLQKAIKNDPYKEVASGHKLRHYFFLDQQPTKPNWDALEKVKGPIESYLLADRVFYLHAPDGVGRSKLAANAEKYLGVNATARNYRTVEQIAAMLAEE